MELRRDPCEMEVGSMRGPGGIAALLQLRMTPLAPQHTSRWTSLVRRVSPCNQDQHAIKTSMQSRPVSAQPLLSILTMYTKANLRTSVIPQDPYTYHTYTTLTCGHSRDPAGSPHLPHNSPADIAVIPQNDLDEIRGLKVGHIRVVGELSPSCGAGHLWHGSDPPLSPTLAQAHA